jgi:hypothetical protein
MVITSVLCASISEPILRPILIFVNVSLKDNQGTGRYLLCNLYQVYPYNSLDKEFISMDREKYILFLEIYHYLRPYLSEESPRRVKDIKKSELVKKFSKSKKMAEEVWDCVFDLKLTEIPDIVARLS